jgi:hypothetical protein
VVAHRRRAEVIDVHRLKAGVLHYQGRCPKVEVYYCWVHVSRWTAGEDQHCLILVEGRYDRREILTPLTLMWADRCLPPRTLHCLESEKDD